MGFQKLELQNDVGLNKEYALDFNGADLRNSDFKNAEFRNADFRNADLRNANFSGADLRGSDLRGADIRGTNLKNADLREVLFSCAGPQPGPADGGTNWFDRISTDSVIMGILKR